ncbi:MAG: 2-C-methyl-D-erythritol 4-phosphate cytidylyltransferase [Lachnospiraceae bacterium]|nr:2-C-methyl-D-erythritol 4-phosphate cytidylyltransferase [Lachnospiraceae bacterium]
MSVLKDRQKPHCTVVLLAGGSGKRMGADKPKQFLEVAGRPLIWYTLNTLEHSEIVDDCVLVVAAKDIPYMQEHILNSGNFTKVKAVAEGGRERFESVWNGLRLLKDISLRDGIDPGVIFIHDGARPFLTEDMLERCLQGALESEACVAAVPSKDTVTIADEEGYEAETPNRKYVWNVQTPQTFLANVVFSAFEKMAEDLKAPNAMEQLSWITDDASVVEHYNGNKIRLIMGDYRNIKVTTQEDLLVMESFLGGK